MREKASLAGELEYSLLFRPKPEKGLGVGGFFQLGDCRDPPGERAELISVRVAGNKIVRVLDIDPDRAGGYGDGAGALRVRE